MLNSGALYWLCVGGGTSGSAWREYEKIENVTDSDRSVVVHLPFSPSTETASNGRAALPFVIPSEVEGSAVPRTFPGNVFRQGAYGPAPTTREEQPERRDAYPYPYRWGPVPPNYTQAQTETECNPGEPWGIRAATGGSPPRA
jgi:hypothetical protein